MAFPMLAGFMVVNHDQSFHVNPISAAKKTSDAGHFYDSNKKSRLLRDPKSSGTRHLGAPVVVFKRISCDSNRISCDSGSPVPLKKPTKSKAKPRKNMALIMDWRPAEKNGTGWLVGCFFWHFCKLPVISKHPWKR